MGSGKRAAVSKPFACQDCAVKTVGDTLVLAEEEADFPSADADIACGNVCELADMPVKFRHEALAETHDFCIGFAFRIKVGAALAAAHRQRGQRILQDLLKPEKLQDGEIDGGVEAKSAFIRT